mgnify:FL=1
MQKPSPAHLLRASEALAIFVVLPLLNRGTLRVPPVAALAALGAYIGTVLTVDREFRPYEHRNERALVTHAPWVLAKFIGTGLFTAAVIRAVTPEEFLRDVRERPRALARELTLYWTLSVIPQELLYRTFFYHRYQPYLPSHALLLMNAAAFGFAHVIFKNTVAPLLTFGAGLLFAHSYERHRSLPLVSLEHALYGGLIFALGLGKYFTFGEVDRSAPTLGAAEA